MSHPNILPFSFPCQYNLTPYATLPFPTATSMNFQMEQYQANLINYNRLVQNQLYLHQQACFQKLLLQQQQQLQNYFTINKTQEKKQVAYPSSMDHLEEQRDDSLCINVEELSCKLEEGSLNTTASSSHFQQNDTITATPDYHQKDAINEVLCYFLTHFGRVDQKEFNNQKMKYAHDPVLVELFDALASRYKTGSKSREDMVRFVMRKSITWLRDQTRNRSPMSAKAASVSLCRRYFPEDSDKSDDELLRLLLPYKKNSRYPVVNSQFMREIFGSSVFCQDYLGYLEKYGDIMKQENHKKIKNFTDFLLSCIRNNCLEKVANYKRVPWLDAWVEASQRIAYEIYELHEGQDKSETSEEQRGKQRKTK